MIPSLSWWNEKRGKVGTLVVFQQSDPIETGFDSSKKSGAFLTGLNPVFFSSCNIGVSGCLAFCYRLEQPRGEKWTQMHTCIFTCLRCCVFHFLVRNFGTFVYEEKWRTSPMMSHQLIYIRGCSRECSFFWFALLAVCDKSVCAFSFTAWRPHAFAVLPLTAPVPPPLLLPRVIFAQSWGKKEGKPEKATKEIAKRSIFYRRKKTFLSTIAIAFLLTVWLGPSCWHSDFAPQFCRSLETGFFFKEKKAFTLPSAGAQVDCL